MPLFWQTRSGRAFEQVLLLVLGIPAGVFWAASELRSQRREYCP